MLAYFDTPTHMVLRTKLNPFQCRISIDGIQFHIYFSKCGGLYSLASPHPGPYCVLGDHLIQFNVMTLTSKLYLFSICLGKKTS